jgi:hypothetical protein
LAYPDTWFLITCSTDSESYYVPGYLCG